MLHKTKGIVLHTTNYSETSVVAKIYTELFGLQSYLINSVRSNKAKIRSAVLQPLSLVEMIVYHKANKGLQRISEIKSNPVFSTIPNDIRKSSIALFINEILYKSLREEEPDQKLFEFVFHSIHLLDLRTENSSDFHLSFLAQLTKYLGFYPHGEYSEQTPIFNLVEGKFQQSQPIHSHFISYPVSYYVDKLLKTSYDSLNELNISISSRRDLLKRLIEYYELHLANFKEVKSYEVLEEIMN